MGISLTGLVTQRPTTMEDLQGKVVAVDVPNLLYPFYSLQLLNQEEVTPQKRESAVQAAIRGGVARVLDLAERGAKSILVFDGDPHPLKAATLAKREAARAKTGLPRLTWDDYERFAKVADAMGLPSWRAKHDGEAEASRLNQEGGCSMVATTDYDVLAMGAQVVLRGLASAPQKWTILEAAAVFRELDTTQHKLAIAATLMGCDYSEGLHGVGPKKALKLANTEGTNAFRGRVPAEEYEAYWEAYRLFTEPNAPPAPSQLTHKAPHLEEVVTQLVRDYGHKDTPELRMRLARLSLLHSPAAAASIPEAASTINKQATLAAWGE